MTRGSFARGFADFVIDVREGVFAAVLDAQPLVQRRVEHLPEFGAGHVSVRIQHLHSAI